MTDQKQVARAIEEHLEGLLPGCQVIDRGLEVEEGPRADLVCTDSEGRLYLVVLVEGGAQETVLLALETLSFLRRHVDVLARHIGVAAPGSLGPRLILVADHFSPKAAARLSPLMEAEEDALQLFELRTMRTDRAEGLWFSRVRSSADEAGLRVVNFESFAERLSEEHQPIARALGADLVRADPAVRCEPRRERATWTLGDRELCTIRRVDDELHFEVPDEDAVVLEGTTDRTAILEPVMRRLLDEVSEAEVEEIEDLPGPKQLEAASPEQLLTAEELEAFRDF